MRKTRMYLASTIFFITVLGLTVQFVGAKEYEVPLPDPADFAVPQDNIYFPMAPGYTYVYEAEEEDGLILNEITETTDTRVVAGITCTVFHDVEWIYVEEEDEWFILEETDDWHAWDNDGNFWYFGEDTIEYIYDDDWNLVGTSPEGSWEAGVDGAMPGIIMLANPMPGLSYQQEYYEDEAEDMGRVLNLNSTISIDYGDFDNCLKTKEWTALSPGEIEHKYYAPGVGLVYIEELKGKTVQVELVDIITP